MNCPNCHEPLTKIGRECTSWDEFPILEAEDGNIYLGEIDCEEVLDASKWKCPSCLENLPAAVQERIH
jgi:hypothetical protein